MLYGNIFISHGFRMVFRIHHDLIGILGKILLSPGNLRQAVNLLFQRSLKVFYRNFHLFQKLFNQAVFNV